MAESSVKNTFKWIYKVVRSVLVTGIILFVTVFFLLYIALSIPPVHNYLRSNIEQELSEFLGSRVEINSLTIRPMIELIIRDARIYDLDNKECLDIGELGAGINIWRLIISGKIEVTHVELLNFKANVYQKAENQPLNIDFIIKAFEPKDKTKPPTRFDLKIHNIVIRNGEAQYSKLWKERKSDGTFDSNYIAISELNGDITIPKLSNDLSEIDLRRLSFNEKSGLQVREISGLFKIEKDAVSVDNFRLRLPQTIIQTTDFKLPFSIFANEGRSKENIRVKIFNSRITPSNFSSLVPALEKIDISFPLSLTATFDLQDIDIESLNLGEGTGLKLNLSGTANNFTSKEQLSVNLRSLNLSIDEEIINEVIPKFLPVETASLVLKIADLAAPISLNGNGQYYAASKELLVNSTLKTAFGEINIDGDTNLLNDHVAGALNLEIPFLDFFNLLPELPIDRISDAKLNILGDVNLTNLASSLGKAKLAVGNIELLSRKIQNINGSFDMDGLRRFAANLEIDDVNLNGNVSATAFIDGPNSKWDLEAKLNDFDTYNSFIESDISSGYGIKGEISSHAIGNNPDNISGTLSLNDFTISRWDGKEISLNELTLDIDQTDILNKSIDLACEIFNLNVEGSFVISKFPGMIKQTLHEILPAIFAYHPGDYECGKGTFKLDVTDAQPLIDFFDLPIFPLTELSVNGTFDSENHSIAVNTDIPFIQQGTNNLITDTYLDLDVTGGDKKIDFRAGTVYPTKKGLLKLDVDLLGINGVYDLNLAFNKGRNVPFFGDINLNVQLDRDIDKRDLGIKANFLPTKLYLNNTEWHVDESEVSYDSEGLSFDNFSIRHDDQFVSISGTSGRHNDGIIYLRLADINLDYVFETLNIPHVTFGGDATGEIIAQNIFSSNPVIRTEKLWVDRLSYNGAVLGDGDLNAHLDLPEKMIAIGALISEDSHRVATVDGGVWFGRDSLAFKFEADKVNVGFMQPFMAAFSSDIRGKASGKAMLFGTFSDIDMTGTLVAEEVDILIDYINARYTGSDTIYLTPGMINIPGLEVHDKFGHTALLEGELTHRYFHDPVFKFTLKDMDNLLVYDTNSKMNNLWYGTIFASGAGEIVGRPGTVTIAADVETGEGSDFTFVLSEQQEAIKSTFLTFSDHRKELRLQEEIQTDTIPDFLKRFRHKRPEVQTESSDIFNMDFRVSVNDDVKFNIIMDPIAGDKITAYGNGAMTLNYTSLTDELKLFGKYILDKGSYNFSLQDIILKDFTIKPGSSIAFTGDPYTGILDITAAYRVNTSLTELDRSFANDRELNRTSVPVEALLKVTGVLTSPNIDFDIELPTVTEETAQKVRSIISTEDMMSRQVLYLVALNKFYPPEYMTTNNTGGEWASIASSTLSSQIQNMIGQITDKFTLAPSIRSDKGDFSDIEVDIALSSQLFDNRLLINGNLGYRDPSNSSTTFVGDFDLEYLLNKKGTWRLKAYNHFNDQNYYLKSALTTQGIGIVWRKEFGIPRKKKKNGGDTGASEEPKEAPKPEEKE